MSDHADVLIIGAGAAGLMAAIHCARTAPRKRVVALDGARRLGAKILVAGGGRCNVTHHEVSEAAYAGSSRNAIRKVLRRFDVPQTVAFFEELGVSLKREETGKLFPTTDRADTVLSALLNAVSASGARLIHPRRVEEVTRDGAGFRVSGEWGAFTAARVILATGGKSLPKSGSDGHGYTLATALGHSLTPRITPALVPLILPADHFLRGLSGVAVPVTLTLRDGHGRTLATMTNPMLCTHFGVSGPAALDISRYVIHHCADDPAASLTVNWLVTPTFEQIDADLQASRQTALRYVGAALPERLARALCDHAGVSPAVALNTLTRAQRHRLARTLTQMPLPIVGDRGYTYAEVTAGGVPLSEIDLKTMESRLCPGLYLCGEICDVDGRIGGYNFQWAWASGYVAGVSAAGDRRANVL